jgi:thiol-disulfide isomerase/thioredoxin
MVKRAAALLIMLVVSIAFSILLLVPVGMGAGSANDDKADTVGSLDPMVLDMAGEKVSFRSFIGHKPLVVVFWATWCPLCRDEVPAINRLAANPAVRVLAVNVGDNQQKVQSFISTYHVSYPVVRDPVWQTTAAYKVLGLPACIILDEGGQVLYRGNGVPGNIEAYLR